MDVPCGSTTLDLGALGTIKGTLIGDGAVKRFVGLPYALPPTGSRRFAKPVPIPENPLGSSNEPYDCTNFKNVCMQPEILLGGVNFQNTEIAESEDCLYLNIWMPNKEPPAEGFPIYVWYHGG